MEEPEYPVVRPSSSEEGNVRLACSCADRLCIVAVILLLISKRGNQHLRSLLVHGARAVVRTAPSKRDPNNQWVNQLRERRGFNRATVAVANKNARIIWAVLRTGEPYRAAF